MPNLFTAAPNTDSLDRSELCFAKKLFHVEHYKCLPTVSCMHLVNQAGAVRPA
jgi:hypothetical protein